MCNVKKLLGYSIIAGLAMYIPATIVAILTRMIYPETINYYTDTTIYREMTDPLMLYFFIHPFVLATLSTWFYTRFRKELKEKDQLVRGAKVGLRMFVLTMVPGMLMTYTSFSEYVAPLWAVLQWSIDGLLKLVVGGIVIVYLVEKYGKD